MYIHACTYNTVRTEFHKRTRGNSLLFRTLPSFINNIFSDLLGMPTKFLYVTHICPNDRSHSTQRFEAINLGNRDGTERNVGIQ